MFEYATVLAFAVAAALFAGVTLFLAVLLRPSVPDPVKTSTYECGMDAVGGTEVKTNIRFYLLALLFVIFDVETLFIYPWAVVVRELGPVALLEMFLFIGILLLGLAFAWRSGALSWEGYGKDSWE
jgi:NADH-quinone oxidoreductase subunit A